MLYELLDLPSLARALPAALLLAADRALLSTTLSRASDVPAASRIQAARHRLTPKQLIGSTKIALRARGVNKRTPVPEALTRLGMRGFLDVAREVLVPPHVERTPGRRAAYLIERGEMPATFGDLQCESLPIEAAAILSGLYGFLSDLPALTRRRSEMQRRRRATDVDIVRRFGSHWRQQCPAPFQREHDELQATLVDELAIADIG
jgi:hypothetical protein